MPDHLPHYRRARLGLILLALLLAFAGACSLTKGKGVAEAAVVKFHDQFNAAQYHEIYEQADAAFKKSASEDEFVALLEAVHRKLGTVKEAHSSGWGVNATPAGTMATLTYDIDFSEGKGNEQFVFHISGDKAALYHYNVNSPLLITR
jgi:hypothetical protein